MKKIDIDRFTHAEEIAEKAFDRVILQKDNSFDAFLNDHKKEFINRFSDDLKIDQIQNEMSKKDVDESVNRLLRRIENHKGNVRRKIPLWLAVSSVASVLFFLSLLVFVPKDKENYICNNAIIVKPTLTLVSGEKVELDRINAQFTNDNVLLSKLEKSKIKYDITTGRDQMTEVGYNQIDIPLQYTFTVILEDSTEVVLNAGSTLKYPVRFSKELREVELNGEAYFKVKKSKIPFVVKTNDCSIRVYGTEFNVNSYRKSHYMETVLLTGKIGFKYLENQEIILEPNQKVQYHYDTNNAVLSTIDNENEIAWLNGFFKYEQDKFEKVLHDIEKWYGVEIRYSNTDNIEMSMTLDRQTDVDSTILFIGTIINKNIYKERKGVYVIE